MSTASVLDIQSSLPEYPQSPVDHRNNPTAIRINGKVTHWETVPLAGSKKATNGNAGFEVFVVASCSKVPLPAPSVATKPLDRFRGVYDGRGGAMLSYLEHPSICSSKSDLLLSCSDVNRGGYFRRHWRIVRARLSK